MKYLVIVGFLFVTLELKAQDQPMQISLWPDGAPGFENRKDEPEQAQDWWVRNVHNPSITVFKPAPGRSNGAAVLICPGGGHRNLVYNSEGRDPAVYLNSIGVTAFVLKYRLFREEHSPYTEETPKQDVFRAMRLIRSRAREFNIDEHRLGIMGFSAGGEVVAWVAYDPGQGDPKAKDPIDRLNSRPDFQILVYPGPLGVPEKVPSNAPPAFMVVANNDQCCSAPIVTLIQRYREAHVSMEAHIYANGDHAFNMGYRSEFQSLRSWPQRMTEWLSDSGFLLAH